MGTPLSFLAGAAVGAAAAYFLDPQGGAQRRNQTREKAVSKAKHGAQDATATAKHAAETARGKAQDVAPSMPGKGEAPDDVTLARKVETEIFRAADAPKGSVSVNAENGVVFLRGALDDPSWIERLGSAAEQVEGVKAVRNLLHHTGTPSPAAPGSF